MATASDIARSGRDVFINCPFDRAYRPLLRAITFAIHDCGYRARSALELDDAGEVRFNKIVRIIRECSYGIHDISRVQLDKSTRLPRFNMPLELGLFLGAREFGSGVQRRKRSLVLDEQPFRYQKLCSDIAGQDIHAHRRNADTAIEIIRNWIAASGRSSGIVIPSGSVIALRYREFRKALPDWCEAMRLNPQRLTFTDDVTLVVAWLSENQWSPA